MDQRIAQVLAQTPRTTLEIVASGALSLPNAKLEAPPSFSEIKRPHAEERTIGIVRVAGTVGGCPWSSVVKLVDLGIPGSDRVGGMTWPEYEEFVYEQHLFADEGMSFRPARCYAVTRPEGDLKLFWLDDLSGNRGAPFSIEEISRMAGHLGEWNGRHTSAMPQLSFPLGRDAYVHRVRGWNYPKHLAQLSQNRDHPTVRAVYPDGSHAILTRLIDVVDRLMKRILGAPHGFAFGDCSVGNVFSLPHETVAIDWASLTDDPIGVDGGCLVGSSLSWGPEFIATVRAESDLWQCYVDGLRREGWRGDDADLRRAGLAQIGSYLMAMSTTPNLFVSGDERMRTFLQGRFGLPEPEIVKRLGEAVLLMPAYADEIEALLV